MDPYAELGVPKDADAATIKRARRKLARKLHPDRNPEGAARMGVINVAFDILMDPQRRANYDQTGSERVQPVEHLARGLVMEGFLAYSQEPHASNVPHRVIERLEMMLQELGRQRTATERALGHFEKKLKHVATDDTVDLWRGVIEQQINGAKTKLAQQEHEREKITLAIEIAKRYRSTVPETEAAHAMRPTGEPRRPIVPPVTARNPSRTTDHGAAVAFRANEPAAHLGPPARL